MYEAPHASTHGPLRHPAYSATRFFASPVWGNLEWQVPVKVPTANPRATGRVLLVWVYSKTARRRDPFDVIHSANPERPERLPSALPQAGISCNVFAAGSEWMMLTHQCNASRTDVMRAAVSGTRLKPTALQGIS